MVSVNAFCAESDPVGACSVCSEDAYQMEPLTAIMIMGKTGTKLIRTVKTKMPQRVY